MENKKVELDKASLAVQNEYLLSQYQQYLQLDFSFLKRKISGTYKSPKICTKKKQILELRVDIDGRRPQERISGDFFKKFSIGFWSFIIYKCSFVVENVTKSFTASEAVLTGTVKYYNDPTIVNETIEVRIPRVSFFSKAADATVKFYTSESLKETYLCPKISEYFRTVRLEIDRIQNTIFPPASKTCVDPHPADLACEDITNHLVFQRAGIDMTVIEDDVLNDSDGEDAGNNWDEGELHDLMENRFDRFANTLQWNLYGVTVPRFGVGNFYDSGYYGVMFDWGGYIAGDTYHRQGSAVAHDAIMGRTSGTLYNTNDKRNRFFLETFIHEVGHAFNLPHSWQRTTNPDYASESFMNYPWGYTGGENSFWSNFRWEFDDNELIWMRHGDRNDVIFGGNDWIGNNLSIYTEPEREVIDAPLSLEVRSREVFDYAQPVHVELKLKNFSGSPQTVTSLLEPEDGWVTVYMIQPDGTKVRYVPPVRRLKDPKLVTLAPKEAIYETIMLSYGAKGPQFHKPGEYRIRAFYNAVNEGIIVSPSCRFRVAHPNNRDTEELANLLFSHEAAKFMYFGGIERYPNTITLLQEATKKYAKTNPNVVQYIHAALGKHKSRPFKKIIRKGERRVVSVRKEDLGWAVNHLEAAWKIKPNRVSVFDNITYNRLSMLLKECYQKQKQTSEATRVLKESLQYFKRRKVVKQVLDDYQKRIAELSK